MPGRRDGIVVAIDGPVASGKSTTARGVARALGYLWLDTGAMYRAVGLAALEAGVPLSDADGLGALAEGSDVRLVREGAGVRVILDGRDVTELIRTAEVTHAASAVAVASRVRRRLVSLQQEAGRRGGVVAEGRDTTTVVFPDAELKVFLTAVGDARARRRLGDFADAGRGCDIESVSAEIAERDERDSTRDDSPLCLADDAVVIDNSEISAGETVRRIVTLARERGA